MLILQLLVFSIPAGIGAILHMLAVKYDLFPSLKIPIDMHQSYKGQRIFGNSKTWRGVILMVLFSIIGSYLLVYLLYIYPGLAAYNIIDFNEHSPVFYGCLFGLAYTLAELPNSFYKRRKGIDEGKRGHIINILVDQADSPIGCMVLLAPFCDISLMFFITGCFFYLLLHLFFNVLLYSIGIRKNPL
jgi:hypothetical protein